MPLPETETCNKLFPVHLAKLRAAQMKLRDAEKALFEVAGDHGRLSSLWEMQRTVSNLTVDLAAFLENQQRSKTL